MQRAGWVGNSRHTTERDAPRRSARRGFTVLELLIVITVIATIASIALPNYVGAKKAANETSAINSMRALVAAQENYRVAKSAGKYATLEQLKDSGLVNSALGSGAMSGYTFMTVTPGASTFAFIAYPQASGGDRLFYVDQTGVIRTAEDDTIGAASPPLK